MKEADIVAAIKAALTKRGAWVIKTHGSPHLAGVPDLLACYRSRFIALEVKQPKTRDNVSLRQQKFLDHIKVAEGIAVVVWDVDMAINILDYVDETLACCDYRTGSIVSQV